MLSFPDIVDDAESKLVILVVANVEVPATENNPERESVGTERLFTESEVMEVVASVDVPET